MRLMLLAAMAFSSGLSLAALSAAPAHAEMFAAKSNWGCLKNALGIAVLRVCDQNSTQTQATYNASANAFQGQFRQDGLCLDVTQGRSGAQISGFNPCDSRRPNQDWIYSGAGEFRNRAGQCISGQGNDIVATSCPRGGAWMTMTFTARLPQAASLPPGTTLTMRNGDLINAANGAMIANRAAIVAAGGGNLIGHDGSTIVAAGGGNLMGR